MRFCDHCSAELLPEGDLQALPPTEAYGHLYCNAGCKRGAETTVLLERGAERLKVSREILGIEPGAPLPTFKEAMVRWGVKRS